MALLTLRAGWQRATCSTLARSAGECATARTTAHAMLDGGLRILYEDDAIIVVNKPPGLLSVPLPEKEGAPSVQSALAEHLPPRSKRRPFVVHRIDRDTSGLVLFATGPDAQQQLKNQFRRHEPLRVYLAFVYGTPDPAAGTWRDHLVWDNDQLIQKATHARNRAAAKAAATTVSSSRSAARP